MHFIVPIVLVSLQLVHTLPLSQYLWQQNAQLTKRIRAHPFITEMESGTLNKAKYDNYIYQDNLYLNYYSRAFAVIAAKTTNNTQYNILMNMAGMSLTEHDTKNKTWDDSDMNDVNVKYTSLFTAAAWQKDPLSGLISLTPCGVLYGYLGREMAKNVTKQNPFYEWISLYNSTQYHRDITTVEGLVDLWGRNVDQQALHKLKFLYNAAMQYEYEFFDIAYHWSS
jgi:thiaminase